MRPKGTKTKKKLGTFSFKKTALRIALFARARRERRGKRSATPRTGKERTNPEIKRQRGYLKPIPDAGGGWTEEGEEN